jgi:hypothetical protein
MFQKFAELETLELGTELRYRRDYSKNSKLLRPANGA